MDSSGQLSVLNEQIAAVKSKIVDTRYLIETALCKETQDIYRGVLKEQEELLARLVGQKGNIDKT